MQRFSENGTRLVLNRWESFVLDNLGRILVIRFIPIELKAVTFCVVEKCLAGVEHVRGCIVHVGASLVVKLH